MALHRLRTGLVPLAKPCRKAEAEVRRDFRRVALGVALIAGTLGSAFALPSCGILSSGDCADKATCVESDVATRGDPDVEVNESAVDGSIDHEGTVVDGAPEVRTDAVGENVGADRTSPDAGHDGLTTEGSDASDTGADNAVGDATIPEVDADAGMHPIPDAYADVPSDAIFMGDTAACGPCTNVCIPSFVQCCIGDGGCGCIEFFFPVLCQ